MAPLPPDWKPCKTSESGELYYFNFKSGESTWDHPCDDHYKSMYEEHKKKKEIQLKVIRHYISYICFLNYIFIN